MNAPSVHIEPGHYPVLGSSPVRWSLRAGVKPVVERVDVTPEAAKALEIIAPGPVTLEIVVRGTTLKIEKLYIINISPGDNRNIFKVTLADRRYWWPYTHVNRAYNIRRHVGFRRIEANDQQAIAQVVPKVWYAKWSLKNPGAVPPAGLWSATDMLRDVLTEAGREERLKFRNSGSVIISDFPEGRTTPIEDLEIDDPGDAASTRALRYVPEADVFIDFNGNIRVYSRASGLDKAQATNAGPEKVGRGHVEVVANAAPRPSKIRVLFTREVELRFNFFEKNEGDTVTELDFQRETENVLPIPDYKLTVNGAVLPQGTWITVNQAINAWNADGPPPGIGRLTHKLIRRAFMPFMDLWSGIELNGQRVPNVNWSARIAALIMHYRRTFRINQRWMDRIMTLRPYRVATVDPSSGSRAPAMAWADHAVLPSQRGLWTAAQAGQELPYILNVRGYPDSDEDIDNKAKAAPARVLILDHDQGIIHLDYQIDPTRTYEMVLPSMVTLSGIDVVATVYPDKPGPTANIRNRTTPITFDAIAENAANWPSLTSYHKAAVVITAVPATRHNANDKDGNLHLEPVEVTPEDIRTLLPPAAQEGLRNCKGPVMEVRVGTGIEPARIQWLGSRSHDIDQIFGIPDPTKKTNTDGLVLNKNPQATVGSEGASLNAIARAVAARVYASMADRVEGALSADISDAVRPAGWLDEVAFEVDVTGEGSTTMRFPEQLQPISMFAFLDASTRAIIMRLAQP